MSNFLDSIPSRGSLSEDQAVDIWLAKWRGESINYLIARFGVSEATIAKVWQGDMFPSAQTRALTLIWERDPELAQQMRLAMPQLEQQTYEFAD